jgi:hypothetical protein
VRNFTHYSTGINLLYKIGIVGSVSASAANIVFNKATGGSGDKSDPSSYDLWSS